MRPENVLIHHANRPEEERESTFKSLHPSWRVFVHCCADLQHGEIEVLRIQDGLPVLAEITRKKIKFTR